MHRRHHLRDRGEEVPLDLLDLLDLVDLVDLVDPSVRVGRAALAGLGVGRCSRRNARS